MNETIAILFVVCGLAYGFLLLWVMRCVSGGKWLWEVMAEQQRELKRYERELRRPKNGEGL